MNYAARLVDEYANQKPTIQQPLQPRAPHLTIPSHTAPFPRRYQNGDMDPNESSTSFGGTSAGNQSFFGSTQAVGSWSEERIQMLQARLARKLGPEYVTQRPGPGGGPKLSYIEGWKVINLANEVFGFNGWSSSIVSLKTDFIAEREGGRVSVNVTAIIRITLRDGCFHEDVGCGQGENIKGKSAALDKAQKEAVTDATKRALRTFGNVLGNCLYDKEYTKEVVKMRVPAAKFNQSELERRPEFTPAGAHAGPSRAAMPVQPMPEPIRPVQAQPLHAPTVAPGTPLRSINEVPVDAYMDESFDAEFLDIGSDSFMDGIDDNTTQAKPVSVARSIVNDPRTESSRHAQQTNMSTYQHRHRPDLPVQPALEQPLGPSRVPRSSTPHVSVGRQISPPDGAAVEVSHRSSGSNSSAVVEGTMTVKPVGGLANAVNNVTAVKDAAAARRLAIASAFNDPTPPAGGFSPIRAESPRIPSGGIDDVAARATTRLRAEGVGLRLDENGVSDGGQSITLGGFASARGMKRSGNEGFEASPTKGPSHQATKEQYRAGPRTALGELQAPRGHEDWGSKRTRMV
ncbi:hypothetical protein IAU60_001996 [Kwoniella sp. DSM 27419]